MEAAPAPTLASPLGRISISHDAVAHIVGRVAAEAYGVVGMAARNPRERLLTRDRLRLAPVGEMMFPPRVPFFSDRLKARR